MPRFPSRALSRAACLAFLAGALAACAGDTPATPADIASVVRASETALEAAASAERVAQAYAARGQWRRAARFVDEAMWALRDARRAEASLKRARVTAAEGRAAAQPPRQLASAILPVPGAAIRDSDDAQIALAIAGDNVAAIERIVSRLKRLDKASLPVSAPDMPATRDLPEMVIPPDTGFDQDVPGAQR